MDTVCLAQPTAPMVYAHSHARHCYYLMLLLLEQDEWPYRAIDGGVEFEAPTLETLAMFALHYA